MLLGFISSLMSGVVVALVLGWFSVLAFPLLFLLFSFVAVGALFGWFFWNLAVNTGKGSPEPTHFDGTGRLLSFPSEKNIVTALKGTKVSGE